VIVFQLPASRKMLRDFHQLFLGEILQSFMELSVERPEIQFLGKFSQEPVASASVLGLA
jgi:hypothetical protein